MGQLAVLLLARLQERFDNEHGVRMHLVGLLAGSQ